MNMLIIAILAFILMIGSHYQLIEFKHIVFISIAYFVFNLFVNTNGNEVNYLALGFRSFIIFIWLSLLFRFQDTIFLSIVIYILGLIILGAGILA